MGMSKALAAIKDILPLADEIQLIRTQYGMDSVVLFIGPGDNGPDVAVWPHSDDYFVSANKLDGVWAFRESRKEGGVWSHTDIKIAPGDAATSIEG
jgi:hypothetical protein